MADEDFLRYLREISGEDAAVWDGFDPSSWRHALEESAVEGLEGAESADGASSPLQDLAYSSDDSAEMILNYHKLTAAERARQNHGVSKLSKARQLASEEVAFPHKLAELEAVKWEETGLGLGGRSADGELFVPWPLVESYPDMFVGKANSVRAAPLFTLDALHEKRVWDLYYIHCPEDMQMDPVIFVPTYQFQHLLDVINAKLETRFTIPPGSNKERFMMSFGTEKSPLPRFLGRSDSAQTFKALCGAIPEPHPDDDLSKVPQLGVEEFRKLLKRTRADRKKAKRSDRNRLKRIEAHKAWGRSIKRVQRYLGLRARAGDGMAARLTESDFSRLIINEPEQFVLFVAIDIEAWEQDQNLITEIGIAVLDTTEVKDIAPGEGCQNWFPLIEARHIRVKENSWATNSRFVRGCADHFSFGTTEFVRESDIAQLLKGVIDDATFVDRVDGTKKPRPVVLVFHESSSDIKYLKSVSYYVEAARNVIEVIDTRTMHQHLVRSNDSASLANVLGHLGIPCQYLHNAGNDAVYTLQAMIGLAAKKLEASLQRRRDKTEGHIPYAEFKQKEGWTSGEDTDGGYAVGLLDAQLGWGSE
ncbi:hypothetical protein MYCTH_101870 [Thermothelomyces thermophilus ATCC 42464]|uniref:Gfd2/YDR514C-like C-terminal domain-containing protein n=1 Tax=Thermothelomyces thermophilus (strain ATCC 42464 / BCRC 31852 / DSM 1799) TaxID=573729 RepID=G2QE32_THET4|nr:uncharacterized protein MYCTH_101870 [Thermothelomyces thermophilus ATCC 42464]AEO57615.1 hypothetical protein MYCTH_101870 [Thermothelomyces thermophilus ATCC 42464]